MPRRPRSQSFYEPPAHDTRKGGPKQLHHTTHQASKTTPIVVSIVNMALPDFLIKAQASHTPGIPPRHPKAMLHKAYPYKDYPKGTEFTIMGIAVLPTTAPTDIKCSGEIDYRDTDPDEFWV